MLDFVIHCRWINLWAQLSKICWQRRQRDFVNLVLLEKINYLSCQCIILRKRRTETDIGLSMNYSSLKWMKRNTTTDARGGATETKVYSYGSGNWVGLLVEVCQKNSTDNEEVNAVVILAHYFANSSGTAFNRSTESDIGLSNAISIANDGRFRGHANGSSIRCKKIYAKGTYPNMSCTPTFVGTN